MARRYFKKLGALAKTEAAYGVDAAPTGAANAIQLSDVSVTPLEGDKVSRDLMLPYFGDQGFVLAATYAKAEFSIEMAGAGAAGTAPAYAALLRACGLAEVVTAGVKVEYHPVSAAQEAASLYFNMDGVNHVLLGARGTLTMSIVPKQIPKFRFTMTGLLGPIADTALPTVDLSKYQKPLVCSKTDTVFSLHGLAAVMESLNLDLGNTVVARMLVNSESIEITDRKVSGTTVIEAVALAVKDWFTIARTSIVGALSVTHGIAAGNIVEVVGQAVQIGTPTYGNTDGITNTSLPLTLCPVTGDDEIVIRIR
ncbi:phage tail tube protein [Methylobacterium sp. WL6]|uniref:phage tail tube protein n=1 Tax=Methylobacterium sp. WL6 TaxID=2603901 RepID=UPI0011CC7567|nr:phage tail tube protein [Methylobacterium sp. WL6]TXN60897.1 hypothetical protein FV230_25060 [Methylobacterium sp. WL6]